MPAKNTTKPETKAFKDWFDKDAAVALGRQLKGAWKRFDAVAFERRVTPGLETLEFSGRVQRFSDAMAEGLPKSMPRALEVVTQSLPPLLPDCEAVTDGYLQWPVGQFIADHGLSHVPESFAAMIELTQRFSSEFAIRPFVEHHPQETFARLRALTSHASPHVRRWCSEGVRPRLPWGKKLTALVADPSPIWPLLDALDGDEALYVRRSVANTLGDIAKDHPDEAIAWAQACHKRGGEGRAWLVKHGLRVQIKNGDPRALALIGFAPPKKLTATLTASPKTVKIGGAVQLEAVLQSGFSRAQDVLVDFVVHYVRKGNKTSGKVFKWSQGTVGARGELSLSKKHNMKVTSIRALYPGAHRVELQVNGTRLASTEFKLREP